MIKAKYIRYHKNGIRKGCEPLEIQRGPIGVFMIHGCTGSPYELRIVASYLQKYNLSIVAPLLPGHGTKPSDLNKVSYKQMFASVEHQFAQFLKKRAWKHVIVGGNCSGGNLAMGIAIKWAKQVDGLFLLSTPIYFDRHLLYALLHPLLPWIPGFYIKLGNDPKLNKAMEHGYTYNKFPIKSLYDMYKMAAITKKKIPQLKVPLLIMHSKHDHVVDPKSARYIYQHSPAKIKKIILYDKQCHVLLHHIDKNDINKEILSFIKRVTRSK